MAEKKQVYNAVFADGSYGRVALGKLINKGGASGKIYLVEGRPESVIKIFHHTEKSATNRQKLQAMLLNKPNFRPVEANGVEYIQIAWPEAILDDEKGFCVGYMMPLINMNEAVSLDHLMQKAVRKKYPDLRSFSGQKYCPGYISFRYSFSVPSACPAFLSPPFRWLRTL